MLGIIRHVAYLAVAIAMVLYALPRIELAQEWTNATVFGIVWLAFALVVISAQLYTLFGVDEAKKRQLAIIKREKAARLERSVRRAVSTAAPQYRRSKE